MTDAFAGASGADLMRPAVPRFDLLFDQVANRARSREHSGGRRNADDVGCGAIAANTSARPTAWLGISDSNFGVERENSSL